MENLKPRQDSFCVHYTTIGAETYSHGTKAALAAGYSESSAHVTATKLLKRDDIRERIIELQAENMKRNLITVDKVLADLEHDKILAREHHQYGVAKGCIELQGKFLAMFTERHDVKQIQTPDVKFITSEEDFNKRIKRLRERATPLLKKVGDDGELTDDEKLDLIELDLLERAKELGNAIYDGN